MSITVTTTPHGTYINNVKVEDELAAAIVRNGKLLKQISETKVIIRPDLNTPGVWRLPFSILAKLY